MAIIFKASLDGDMRRFTLEEPTLTRLNQTIVALFTLDARQPVVIEHIDGAGETHIITHTDQLRLLASHLVGRPFKVTVHLADPDQEQPPPPPRASSANEANVDYDSKAQAGGGSGRTSPQAGSPRAGVDDFTHFANEFHYHRLIVQTAVEHAFRSLGRSITKAFETESVDNFMDNSQRRLAVVREAIKAAFADVKTRVEHMPTSTEMAARVASVLTELRIYSASTIDAIRRYVEAALQRLLSSRFNRITASNINEVVDEVVEDIQMQGASAAAPDPQPEQQTEQQPEPEAQQQQTPYPTVPEGVEEQAILLEVVEQTGSIDGVMVDDEATTAAAMARSPATMSFESVHSFKDAAEDDGFIYVEDADMEEQQQQTALTASMQSSADKTMYTQQLATLASMGFSNADRNANLLALYQGNVDAVVQALVRSSTTAD